MDPAIGWTITAIVIAIVVVVAIARQLPRVGVDERLVVFRMGRTNASLVRGPGRALVVPIIDRVERVDMRPQQVVLDDVPGTTSDAREISVDMIVGFRVLDPLMWVVSMPVSTEFAIRSVARRLIAEVASGMALGDVLTAGRMADVVGRRFETKLIEVGCGAPHVKVSGVHSASVVEADERRMEAMFAAAGRGPDPDVVGSRTLAGDLAWGLGRFPRMLRYALLSIPVAIVLTQVFMNQYGQAWSWPLIAGGAFFGFTFGAMLDQPIGRRRVGRRRMTVWWVLMVGWWLTCLGLLWIVGRLVDPSAWGLVD